MKPPPPGLLSTSTRWFHVLPSLSATRRNTASGPLPGANAVTSVTGLAGNGSAAFARGAAEAGGAHSSSRGGVCMGVSGGKAMRVFARADVQDHLAHAPGVGL